MWSASGGGSKNVGMTSNNNVAIAPLAWGDLNAAARLRKETGVNLIVCADLIYYDDGRSIEALVETLKVLVGAEEPVGADPCEKPTTEDVMASADRRRDNVGGAGVELASVVVGGREVDGDNHEGTKGDDRGVIHGAEARANRGDLGEARNVEILLSQEVRQTKLNAAAERKFFSLMEQAGFLADDIPTSEQDQNFRSEDIRLVWFRWFRE